MDSTGALQTLVLAAGVIAATGLAGPAHADRSGDCTPDRLEPASGPHASGHHVALEGPLGYLGTFRLDDPLLLGVVFERSAEVPGVWSEAGPLAPQTPLPDSSYVGVDRGPSRAGIDAARIFVSGSAAPAGATIDAGAIAVFDAGTEHGSAWSEVARLTAPAPVVGGRFGRSMDFGATYAVFGAPEGRHDCCQDEGWTFVLGCQLPACRALVEAARPACEDWWDDDCALLAADLCGDLCALTRPSAGTAAVFVRDAGAAGGWSPLTTIAPSDGQAGDGFGTVVSVEGSTIAVAAPEEGAPVSTCCDSIHGKGQAGCGDPQCESLVCDVMPSCCTNPWDLVCAVLASTVCGELCGGLGEPSNRGAVYVFEPNPGGPGFVEVARLSSPAGAENDRFGQSVVLDGGRLYASGGPSLFVFERSGADGPAWVLADEIVPTRFPSQWVVGGPFALARTNRAVEIYREAPGGWTLVTALDDPEAEPFEFGRVALDGVTALLGSTTFGARGSVLVLPITACLGCPADVDGDAAVSFADLLVVLAAWGTADPSADIDASGHVDFGDILQVLSGWGACG